MFKLTLGNNTGNKTDLLFKTFKTSIAKKWANEIAKNYPLYETDRFTNWPGSTKSKQYYELWLKHHMNIICQYGYPINIEEIGFQDALNELHKHFEDLRGHVDRPSIWYQNAPEKIKNSVDRLNVLIHEYENFLDEERQLYRNPTIVGTFKDRPKFNLNNADYKHFTHQWKFGTVYINYCEVGKPLLDVFKDQDNHVGIDAIRPQSMWSADFMIKFGLTVPDEYVQTKETLFWKWFNKQNLDINPNRAALGMIPVAQLVSDVDVKYISNFDRIEQCTMIP